MEDYNIDEDKSMDELIKPIVILLMNYGFETFESCQGGEGHCFPEPTIRFHGNEFDLLRAYEICENYDLNPLEVKRVYRKVDLYTSDGMDIKGSSLVWDKPFNEITFLLH